MNQRSRLIVNTGCAWIGSLASLTVKRRLEVSVIGYSLTINIAGNTFMPLIGCSSSDLIILPLLLLSAVIITFLSGVLLLESLSVENEYGRC